MSDSDQLEMNLPTTGTSGVTTPAEDKSESAKTLSEPFKTAQSSLSDDIKKALLFNERDLEAFPSLLERGMDINQTDNNNNTLLMLAAIGGNLKITTLLISKGADIQKENGSFTALRYAIANEHADIVRLLVDAGASLIENSYEYSQKWAEDKGLTEIAQMLRDAPEIRRHHAEDIESAKETTRHEAIIALQLALKERAGPHKLIIRPSAFKISP